MNLFTFAKKALLLFCFLLLSLVQVVYAANIQSTGAGGLWNNASSWSPAVVPNAGDIVTINNGSPIQIITPSACATITINSGAVLTMMSSMTVTGSFTVNGTLNCNQGFVFGACSFTLANSNNAFLMIGDASGISSGTTALGNIENTGGRNFPASANYVYDGIGNQNVGNGLPATINGGGSLTIDNTGTAPTDVVTLASSGSIQNVYLQSGILSLNGKTITVNGTILNTGGNLAITGTGGADGGTFIIQGATINGPTTFYNLTTNTPNSTITTSGLSAPLIDGTLLIGTARFGGTNSPRYAKGSTLSYAGTANNRGLEWNADLSTTPTIGVTQGYPDNVFINSGSDFDVCNYPLNGNVGAIPRGLDGNLTASAFTMLDWIPYTNAGPYQGNPLLNQTGSFTVGHNMIVNSTAGGNIHMSKVGGSGAFTIKGSLTINGATANVNLDSMTNAFTVDSGITINNGILDMGLPGVATKLNVTGDVTINGGTVQGESGTISLTGAWKRPSGTFTPQNGTVDFNGTVSQVITSTGGELFNNVIIDNANDIGMTYGTTINGNLTFIKGLFLTYSSADLTIGSSGNIIGASQSTGWVARSSGGNLIRNITTTSPYLFAIGNINTYTPVTLTFSSVTAPGTVAMNTPGSNPATMPGYVTYGLSKTDYLNWYWYINKISGTLGSYTAALNYGTALLEGAATIATLKTGVYDGSWTYPSSSGTGTTVTATGILPLNGSLENIALANGACTPPTVYNVTGTGSYCTGGVAVGLNNSQTSVHYQLQTPGPINVGSPVAGTGAAISFGNQTTGTYTVLATNDTSACTSNMADTAFVTLSTAPSIVTPGTTQNVCFNNTAAQNAALAYSTPLNGPTNYSITWDAAALTAGLTNVASTSLPALGTSIQIPVSAGVVANTYSGTITVTSAGGCSSAGNPFTITINSLPAITGFVLGGTCFSSSTQNYNLTYTGTTGSPTKYAITWDLPTSLVNVPATTLPPSPVIIAVPAAATAINNTGKIYVTDINGCTSTGNSITVTIYPLPTPTFIEQPGANSCSNTLVTYITEAAKSNYIWTIPGTAAIDYTVFSGGASTDNTITVQWLSSGSKTISINYTNINSCVASSPTPSVPTTIGTSPDASNLSIASTTPVCAGISNSTIIVNSTTLAADTYTVIYTLGAPNVTNYATATMVFSGGKGTFTIPAGNLHATGSTTVTITGLENSSCSTNGLAATGSIAVNAITTPTFTSEPGASACDHTDIVYTTQAGESNYTWTYSGILNTDYSIVSGGSSTDNSVTLQWLLSTGGNKTVTVNYTNANNCAATNATTSTPTKINICNTLPLYIPNAFAPEGANPVWHIVNSEDYPNMQVQIFNRWGKKVFECKGATTWNGIYEGQNLPQGVYVYIINVNDERYKQLLQGSITLIQ